RARGTVPRRELEQAARGTDVGLREPRLDERVADGVLRGRDEPGPVIAEIVEVRAVDDDLDATPPRLGGTDGEEVALAEVAPIRRVLGVAGDVELVRVDDHVLDAARDGELLRAVDILRGGRRGHRRERHAAAPEDVVRDAKEE